VHFLGATHHHVTPGVHAPEKGKILKGPGDSHGGHMVGFHLPGPLLAFKKDVAFISRINAIDDVQHGRFAGTIRPDDGHNLPRIYLQADPIEGLQASETDVYVFHAEQGFFFLVHDQPVLLD
jgi:hypothetical protein